MNGYKFPRTYADLEAAPWLESTCPGLREFQFIARNNQNHEYLILNIDLDWVNPEIEYVSPGGLTLKDALRELRELWPEMRPPELGGNGPCGGCQGV